MIFRVQNGAENKKSKCPRFLVLLCLLFLVYLGLSDHNVASGFGIHPEGIALKVNLIAVLAIVLNL